VSDEYKVLQKYFRQLTNTLVDIDGLYPYFIQSGIINLEDVEEIKSKPRSSEQVCQFLKHIEGPLKVNNTKNFFALLDTMSTHGNISTVKLAADIRGMYTVWNALSKCVSYIQATCIIHDCRLQL